MKVGYIKEQKFPITIIDKLKYYCGIIFICEYEQGCVFQLPKLRKKNVNKILLNLSKQLQKSKIDTIVFSKEYIQSEFYSKMLDSLDTINILTGKKLMHYMNYEILEYIFNIQKTTMKQQDVYFLIKKDNNLDLQFLSKFVENCKTVNVVTNDISRFKKIQENLYEKENILISVSNNKNKALKRAKYILNINMNKKELEKFKINRDAIIINFGENITYNNSTFNGININYFEIHMPDELIEQLEQINSLNEFNENSLYEAILLKKIENLKNKTTILSKKDLNIHKNMIAHIIKDDNIYITGLIGNNGKICEEEFASKTGFTKIY